MFDHNDPVNPVNKGQNPPEPFDADAPVPGAPGYVDTKLGEHLAAGNGDPIAEAFDEEPDLTEPDVSGLDPADPAGALGTAEVGKDPEVPGDAKTTSDEAEVEDGTAKPGGGVTASTEGASA